MLQMLKSSPPSLPTSLQRIKKCCLPATITAPTTCCCSDGNISSISATLRGSRTKHGGHYGFNSAITRRFAPSSAFLSFPVPVFYFGNTDYHVDESEGYVEVQVWRTGTDLSKAGSVTVRSRKTDPVSAEGMCRRTKSFPCTFRH